MEPTQVFRMEAAGTGRLKWVRCLRGSGHGQALLVEGVRRQAGMKLLGCRPLTTARTNLIKATHTHFGTKSGGE